MEKIIICPDCGSPAIKVNAKTVKRHTGNHKAAKKSAGSDWHACINISCTCAYFSKLVSFSVSDLVSKLFYKDKADNVPVCYCAGISRGEIKKAVGKGCKTVGQVHKFTGKHKTGDCKKKNPLGKCCTEVFKWEINSLANDKAKNGNHSLREKSN